MNIQSAECEQLQNHQVLRRASPDIETGRKGKRGRARDYFLFERQSAERYVNSHSAWRLQQQDAMAAGEFAGILNPAGISGEQSADDALFPAKTRQHGKIHVPRHPRLAPSLDGDPADAAGTPALRIAEGLELAGCLEEIDHRPSFEKYLCISTKPEDGRGGRERTA